MPGKKVWVPFKDAKSYVHTLKLKNFSEWRTWTKSTSRPYNIPTNPREAYKNEGWISWGDWLGTNTRAKQNRKYRSFLEARQYAHSLAFKSRADWEKFRKTNEFPKDIPAKPDVVYRFQGWISWGDFLGSGTVAWRFRQIRPFKEARNYVRSLNFKNQAEWHKYSKSGLLPKDIPSYPNEAYEAKGWISWGDWLGTGVIASQNREFRPFREAKAFVRSLELKNNKEFRTWSKSNKRPNDIPTAPDHVYADEEWISWGDFLGTGVIGPTEKNFKPFNEARIFARSLKFKMRKEWENWAKTKNRPHDIPASPSITYKNKGWNGWGDWLGTGVIAHFNKKFRPFHEARDFARSLLLSGKDEWARWAKSSARPIDIPTAPDRTYAKLGWNGWGYFLGSGNIANHKKTFRPFEEARKFARSLQFTSSDQWSDWSKSKERPIDIPSAPDRTYAKLGWQGWGDFLGTEHVRWSIDKLRDFVKSILIHIPNMPQMDRLAILQSRGIYFASRGKIIAQKILQADEITLKELEKFANNEKCDLDLLLKDNYQEENQSDIIPIIPLIFDPNQSVEIIKDFPIVETRNILGSVNQAVVYGCDSETVDFLIKSSVGRIWKHAFEDLQGALLQVNITLPPEEMYMKKVQEQFLEEFNETQELIIPSDYSFPHPPELMQKYTACLIRKRKRFGNWCGTGAGKTLASILASRVIKAQCTIICCPNNVIETWKKEINKSFPNSLIIVKNWKEALKENVKPVYLILNYEIFKEKNYKKILDQIILKRKIDFVIVDEIHQSKQRKPDRKLSQRRRTLLNFLAQATIYNEQLHVLGMSATPVINNLFEGKALIEMITGKKYDDLETRPTRNNCVALYKQLIIHGFRWLPDYKIHINLKPENFINASWLLPDLIKLLNIRKDDNFKKKIINPQPLEALLTKAKIPFILNNLKPSTIIYTYYVDNIVIQLQNAIEQTGWRVGIFTGTNKTGLEPFLHREVDILIVSNCASTGLDGLQKVSNRIIINSLPWTHAEFKQLQGRILRKGQASNRVEILIPLTFVEIDGKKWSWCESRWERIKFKKSIADAAVDGILPESMHISEHQALKEAKAWILRIIEGKINEIIREPISVSLDEPSKLVYQRKIADLTKLNQEINQNISQYTHKRFSENPDEFYKYHETYREVRKQWDIIPYEEAIAWCKLMPFWIIGDFGCGEAFLSKELSNKVHAFDHVAINQNVTACDMSEVPLECEMLDAAVFSLSLMGTNFIDYLKEAKRCLKLYGHLWIAEPTSRIRYQALFIDLIQRLGFDVYHTSQKGKFTFIKAIKSNRSTNEVVLRELATKKILD